MIDVTLIHPPLCFVEHRTEEGLLRNYNVGKAKIGIWPALGLLYLASSLRQEGISVNVIDAFIHGLTLDQLMSRIDKLKPKIVGILTTTMQTRAAVQIAERIKERFGDSILVAAGGPHISIDPDFVKRFNCFDFAVMGEAEITFVKVVKNILNGGRPEKIYISELPERLDDLPLPARDLINIIDYFPSEKPYIPLLAMRGCPFKCIFCSKVAISDKVRYRTPAKVVDELEELISQYKIKSFVFVDDVFTLNKSHTLELCKEVINRRLKIRWFCNTRADTIDRELLQYMKKAGCYLILIGVESGDEQLRKEVVNKKINDSDIAKIVKWCKELKISIGCYLMLGFPGETQTQIKKTIDFPIKFDMDLMSIHTTAVYPGSELFGLLAKEGKADILEQWDKYARGKLKLDELSLIYIPEELSVRDLQDARKKAYLKFYFRPKIIFKQLFNDLRSWRNLKRDFAIALMLLKFGKTSKDLV